MREMRNDADNADTNLAHGHNGHPLYTPVHCSVSPDDRIQDWNHCTLYLDKPTRLRFSQYKYNAVYLWLTNTWLSTSSHSRSDLIRSCWKTRYPANSTSDQRASWKDF